MGAVGSIVARSWWCICVDMCSCWEVCDLLPMATKLGYATASEAYCWWHETISNDYVVTLYSNHAQCFRYLIDLLLKWVVACVLSVRHNCWALMSVSFFEQGPCSCACDAKSIVSYIKWTALAYRFALAIFDDFALWHKIMSIQSQIMGSNCSRMVRGGCWR